MSETQQTAGVLKVVVEELLIGGDGLLIPRDGVKNRSATARRYIYNIIYTIYMHTLLQSVPPDPLAPRNTAAGDLLFESDCTCKSSAKRINSLLPLYSSTEQHY